MPLLWNRFSATSQMNVQCNEYPRNAQHEHYLPDPCMFCRYHPWCGDFIFTQGIYMAMEHEFQRFNFPHIPAIHITFVHAGGIVISDTQPPIFFLHIELILMPQNFRCSGSSAFSKNIYQSIRIAFCRHSAHFQDMYYINFRHFRPPAPWFICSCLNDAPDIPHFSRTFAGTLRLCFSDIPDTPRTSITCGIFISDTSDNQHPI